ncbi:MAG TPA: proline dehydrogenase family protein, partial [Flavisolibacter sp.]
FRLMGKPWLVSAGTRLAPWSIRAGLPVKGLIRKTIFRQFVGGETMEECKPAIEKMRQYHVQVILDYGVEGKEGEKNYDQACEQFIRVINFAATQPNVPYMSVKVTGIARFGLMAKLDQMMRASSAPTLIARYKGAVQALNAEESAEWQRVHDRIRRICEAAATGGVGFLVDAEETWIQEPLDALVMLMMDQYNKTRLVIYNTLQMYRHDRLQFLKESFEAARQRNFFLGAKLVRGAYLEKERKRAADMGYQDPMHRDKESTDRDYDDAVRFCIDHIDRVGLMVASHNERSNMLATELLREKGLPLDHPHVHFSQLYGMSDNITYNLARAGCSVSKYLPFGPIRDVIPYLMRRAQENTSVGGQTSRELSLIEKELKRRGL